MQPSGWTSGAALCICSCRPLSIDSRRSQSAGWPAEQTCPSVGDAIPPLLAFQSDGAYASQKDIGAICGWQLSAGAAQDSKSPGLSAGWRPVSASSPRRSPCQLTGPWAWSPIARIPEVHGESKLALSSLTQPLPRSHWGPETKPGFQVPLTGSPDSPSSASGSALSVHPLSIFSWRSAWVLVVYWIM